MGGNATFAGTDYQASVIAFAYVHMLASIRLRWFPDDDDTPLSLGGETGGPGDDARVDFGLAAPAAEVQAKHGLTGGRPLDEVLERVRSRTAVTDPQMRVALVVNRGSSRRIWLELQGDLPRIRSERFDAIHAEAIRTREAGYEPELRRLYIVPADLDPVGTEAKFAKFVLSEILADPSMADAAWDVLVADAARLCAERLARTRYELVNLLRLRGILLKSAPRTERPALDLDVADRFLDSLRPGAALAELVRIEPELSTTSASAQNRYRYHVARARALLMLGRNDEARTHAHEALRQDDRGAAARRVLARVALVQGHGDRALQLANDALAADTADVKSWAVRLQVGTAVGAEPVSPPLEVAAHPTYRLALAEQAAESGDWSSVIELTQPLVTEASTPSALLLLAQALLAISTRDEGEDARWAEAETCADAFLERVGLDSPWSDDALVLRGTARGLQGRRDEAEADLRDAKLLSPENPEIARREASSLLIAERPREALEVLSGPATTRDPLLLAIRAEVHASLGEASAAERDLESAATLLPQGHERDDVLLVLAEAATSLGRSDRAQAFLDLVAPERRSSAHGTVLAARVAWLRGDIDTAETLYTTAAGLDSQARAAILSELGSRFAGAGQEVRALAVLDPLDRQIVTPVLPAYAKALYTVGRYADAQIVVDRLAEGGELALDVLALATDLAILQDDSERAQEGLEALIAQNHQPLRARIALAGFLLDAGRLDEVRAQVAIARASDPGPVDRLEIAKLLLQLGDGAGAVMEAYGAFRAGLQNPLVHRGFASLVFAAHLEPPVIDQVGPDTAATLVNESEERRTFLIVPGDEADPLRREMSLATASSLGILGARVGDRVDGYRGLVPGSTWTVEAIQSGVVWTFQDVVQHYEERFPTEPFVNRFTIGDDPSIADFAPIIGSVISRHGHVQHALELYASAGYPLGMIAHLTGGSIPELVRLLMSEGDDRPLLVVDWPDEERQRQAVINALRAPSLVLTSSAIELLDRLDLLEAAQAAFTLVAPRSLRLALRQAVAETAEQLERGSRTIGFSGGGMRLYESEPGDRGLQIAHERATRQLAWAEGALRFVPRPIDAIRGPSEPDHESRDILGPDSMDAVDLSERGLGSLYADDLGLRRYTTTGVPAPSTSTPAVVRAMAALGAITPGQRDDALIRLIASRVVHVRLSGGLLLAVQDPSRGFDRQTLGRVFARLADPNVPMDEAVTMAADAIRHAAVGGTLTVVTASSVTAVCLEVLAGRATRQLAASGLAAAMSERLRLVPQRLEPLLRQIREFGQAG